MTSTSTSTSASPSVRSCTARRLGALLLAIVPVAGATAAAPVVAPALPTMEAAAEVVRYVTPADATDGTVTAAPGETLVVDERERSVRDLLVEHGDVLDPDTYSEVAAAWMEQQWGAPLAIQEVATAEAAATPEPHGPYATADGGADLNGDGLEDALLLIGDHSTPYSHRDLRAYSGADGSLLWSIPASDFADSWETFRTDAVGDLDGDGIDDLFFGREYPESHEYVTDECEQGADSCVYELIVTYEWVWKVRSGRTGEKLWSVTRPGRAHIDYVDRPVGEYGRERHVEVEVDALAALPAPGADHDGDGTRDIVMNVFDVEYEIDESRADEPAAIDEGTYRYLGRTEGSLLNADGTPILTLVREGQGLPELHSVGDVVGDPTTDLAWTGYATANDTSTCVAVAGSTVTCPDPLVLLDDYVHEVIDGATLEAAWTRTVNADVINRYIYPLKSDLDGDGRDDFMQYHRESTEKSYIEGYVEDESTLDRRWTLLSGADGAEVWSNPDLPEYVTPTRLVDAGGGAGPDLLYEARYFSITIYCGDLAIDCKVGRSTLAHVIVRVDGMTGEILNDTSRSWTGDHGGGFAIGSSPPGDVDGDGVLDISFTGFLFDEDDQPHAHGVLQSAQSGEDLHELEGVGIQFLTVVPDLTGDGRDEVVLSSYPNGLGEGCVYVVRDLATDADLWGLACGERSLSIHRDQDGVAGGEVIERRYTYDPATGRQRLFLDGLSGDLQHLRWSVEVAPIASVS